MMPVVESILAKCQLAGQAFADDWIKKVCYLTIASMRFASQIGVQKARPCNNAVLEPLYNKPNITKKSAAIPPHGQHRCNF